MKEYFDDLRQSIASYENYGNEQTRKDTEEILTALEQAFNSMLEFAPDLMDTFISYIYVLNDLIRENGVILTIDRSGFSDCCNNNQKGTIIIGDKDLAYQRYENIIHEIAHAILEKRLNIDYNSEQIRGMLSRSKQRIIQDDFLGDVVYSLVKNINQTIEHEYSVTHDLSASRIDYSTKPGTYIMNSQSHEYLERISHKIEKYKDKTFESLSAKEQEELINEAQEQDLIDDGVLSRHSNDISMLDIIGAIFTNDFSSLGIEDDIFDLVAHRKDYYSEEDLYLIVHELFANYAQLALNPNFRVMLEALKTLIGEELYNFIKTSFSKEVDMPSIASDFTNKQEKSITAM